MHEPRRSRAVTSQTRQTSQTSAKDGHRLLIGGSALVLFALACLGVFLLRLLSAFDEIATARTEPAPEDLAYAVSAALPFAALGFPLLVAGTVAIFVARRRGAAEARVEGTMIRDREVRGDGP